ncbi:MAG: hypothetical protein IPH29_16120 [Candidatus Microthrix sp.]|nr:hypothetical protein [Candidatus Microthrix sp.]
MIVEVVGLGAVGRRLLTELLSTPSVELVRVRSRRHEVAAAQVGGLERVEIVGGAAGACRLGGDHRGGIGPTDGVAPYRRGRCSGGVVL